VSTYKFPKSRIIYGNH
jgi:hypothetical protein